MKDGEKIIAAVSFDSRLIASIKEAPDYYPEAHGLAASSNGYALRFSLESFAEPSTRSGRRFARVTGGASIIDIGIVSGTETLISVSAHCRAVLCPVEEISYLSGAGKGVMLMRLASDDHLLGFKVSEGDRDLMTVETNRGAQKNISTAKYRVTSRGGRGVELQKNGRIAKIVLPPAAAPPALDEEGGG